MGWGLGAGRGIAGRTANVSAQRPALALRLRSCIVVKRTMTILSLPVCLRTLWRFRSVPRRRRSRGGRERQQRRRQSEMAEASARAWLPVSTHCSVAPVAVFQNRMHRSAVPPPLASRPCWCGDHAMAFTAAACSQKRSDGAVLCPFHTSKRLSLPPLASSRSSGLHFSPHTCARGGRTVEQEEVVRFTFDQ